MSETHQIKTVKFQPGEYLFREGEQSYHFYVIQSGEVEIFKSGPDHSKVPLAIVDSGHSVGEFAMIDRAPRSASAQALTQVEAALISETAYQELFSELPDWAVAVMKAMVDRLRKTNEILRQSGSIDKQLQDRISNAQFDPDADTVIDENTLLKKR